MTNEDRGYEHVQAARQEVIAVINDLMRVASDVGFEARQAAMMRLREKVQNDKFRVMLAGDFNAGKSTLINSMLGEPVLPRGGQPMTAVLCVCNWALAPSATLFKIAEDTGALEPTPYPIKIDELAQYVTIPAQEKASDVEILWGQAEIGWPLPILKSGVEIIDSPGLNESADHNAITLGHLGNADSLVYVVNATHALSTEERKTFDEQFGSFRHGNMFCVVNRFDQVDDPEDVRADINRRVKEYWDLGPERVFYTAATKALRGRMEGDAGLVKSSGMPEFEQALEKFLATYRGYLKIGPPAADAQGLITDTDRSIISTTRFLDQGFADLKAKYDKQQEPLARMKRTQAAIDRSLGSHNKETQSQIENSARRMLTDAADNCSAWATEIDRTKRLTAVPWKMRSRAEEVAEEIAGGLGHQVRRYVRDWQKGALAEIVEVRAEDLEAQVGLQFGDFETDLATIRSRLLDTGTPEEEMTPLSVGAGDVKMTPELLKSLGIGTAVSLGAIVLLGSVFFLPVVLIGLILGAGPVRGLLRGRDRIEQRIVQTVSNSMAQKLREEAPDLSAKMANSVFKELERRRAQIGAQLTASIASVHEEVQVALRKMQDKDADNQKAKAQLAVSRSELKSLHKRVGAVIAAWPQP